MKIEKIKQGKRDREKLVIITECGAYISARIDDAYNLKAGDEISEELAAELSEKYNAQKVKMSAARSLAHHSMSKSALSKKLTSRGFSKEEAEETAEWFEKKGLVDDAALAKDIAAYYKRRGFGCARIREELYRRGIEKELLEETLMSLGSFEEEISALLAKKLAGKTPDDKEKQKLCAFLMRRGFKSDEIRAALKKERLDTEETI